MESYDFKQRVLEKISSLQDIVKQGLELGFDFQPILDKIDRIKQVVDDGVIKIVMLGSFSDGKTSAIAGLLGQLEDDMKIDPDESSDEIKVYRPFGLKKGFEIVDTPGLFGSKEKEINGQMVRFSDITKNYISEAHIVIYLCNAVVPLKESHVEIVRKVLRDLKKLDSTIFVINKMDETNVDMLDDEDYARGAEIKKQNLIGRLRSAINLTPDEERKLKIVCISADPKSKGISEWLKKWQDYKKRSHIDLFRKAVDDVIENTDVLKVKEMASKNSVKEMLDSACQVIENGNEPIKDAIQRSEKILKSMEEDSAHLKNDLIINQKNANARLDELFNRLLSQINGANLETIGSFIEQEIGVQPNKETQKSEVTFWVLEKNIRNIFDECGASNQNAFDMMNKKVDFEGKFVESNKVLEDTVKKSLEKGCAEGAKHLGKINVNGEMVKAARNVIAKGFKFKPWGAKKLAESLNVWAGRFADVLKKAPAIIAVAMEAWSWFNEYKNQKELNSIKVKIKNAINDVFAEYSKLMRDSVYFENLAPSYSDLMKKISEQQCELNNLRNKMESLEKYKARYDKWIHDNVQDAEVVV